MVSIYNILVCMNKAVVLAGVVVIIVGFIAYLNYAQGTDPGKYDLFAGCLSEAGFVMAGTDGCHYCQQQKETFGSSFKFVNYKNCFYESEWCRENGVIHYPAWVGPDGTVHEGKKTIDSLSTLSGCDLNGQR